MTAVSRLNSFDADVAMALQNAAPEVQLRVAGFAAEWAVAHTGLAHPALATDTAASVAALVAELDDRYFTLSEEREEGRAGADDVVAAFGLARAASAVAFVRRGEPAEAIYEAAAAVEDWSTLRVAVLAQLAGK